MTRQTHIDNLILELSGHGLTVTEKDVTTILADGIDSFLLHHQVHVPEKRLTLIYLIINALKNERA